VLIGGMPAARVGDPLVCPGFDGPKPHVMGNILTGSTTVIIDGAFAARMGDPTGCGVAGVVGKGMLPTIGPKKSKGPDVSYSGVVVGAIGDESGNLVGVKGKEEGKNAAGVLWGQVTGDANWFGARGEVEGSVIHAAGETDSPVGKFSGAIDQGNVKGEAHIGLMGAGASGEANVIKAKVSWETSQENPVYAGVEGEAKVLTASAKADVLMGTDGRRTGIGVGLGASAGSVKGDAKVSGGVKIPIPFTNKAITVGGKGTFGASAGSVGAGGEAAVFHDSHDNKIHGKIGGELAALVGLKLDLEVILGLVDRSPPKPPSLLTTGVGIPMTPGSIMIGAPTVLIG
jgi:uncharacterized Zn-binding protein involved in type VI secretion